ncbi:MAG: DUF1573 domain-containing protein [Planctomycetaceae bacterium]
MRKHDLRTLTIVAAALAALTGWMTLQTVLGGSTREAGGARAVLSAVATHYDLGQTAADSRWQLVFPIRNLGTRRLVLNELDTGCDCGDDPHSSIVVPPGGTVELVVPLDTLQAAGPVESERSFTTNDPRWPRLELKARALVAGSPTTARAAADAVAIPIRAERREPSGP